MKKCERCLYKVIDHQGYCYMFENVILEHIDCHLFIDCMALKAFIEKLLVAWIKDIL